MTTEPRTGHRHGSRRAVLAGSAGTFIEWYDYGLYAYVAAIVFAPRFFTPGAGDAATVGTFGIFAAGFVARPVGGIVFGALGDRWGRRPVLLTSIVLVGAATAAIGVLPPYSSIGVWAPLLLILCRIAQGFGTGAELGTAMVYVSESADPRRKGYHSSLLYIGTMAGGILSLVLFVGMRWITGPEAFVSWGWRVPFLFALVLTVVALVVRRGVEESEEFDRLEEARERGLARPGRANPLAATRAAFAAGPSRWWASFLMPTASNVIGYVVNAFGISYLARELHLSFVQTMLTLFVMYVAGVVALPWWGRACDRFGARRVLTVGAVAAAVTAFPFFALLQTHDAVLVGLAFVVVWVVGWAPSVVAQLVIAPSLFPTESRAAGLTSSRELQQAFVAGPTPLLAATLVTVLHGEPWLVAGLLVVAQVVTLASLALCRGDRGAAGTQLPAPVEVRPGPADVPSS